MRRYAVVSMLFCLLARAFAQTAASTPEKLTTVLDRTMRGQPVVAVQMGKPDVVLPEGAPGDDAPLVERLQSIAEAASRADIPLIPFAVRKTWVIAPETRDEVRSDLSGIAPDQMLSRRTLMELLLRRLSPEQVQRLGSREGLPMEGLRPEQKKLADMALRPPLVLEEWTVKTTADGKPRGESRPVARLEEPLTGPGVALHADLSRSFHVFTLPGDQSLLMEEPGTDRNSGLKLTWPGWNLESSAPGSLHGIQIPSVESVPNRLKPSDLDGQRYATPAGFSGVMTVREALAKVAGRTGLRLVADKPYQYLPVFVGSADVPCGDVLDGIRLGLSAAWRKVGNTYLLAWDQRGLRAVQTELAEFIAPAILAARKERNDPEQQRGERRLGQLLPFAADDPLVISEDQRRRLFEPVKTGDPHAHGVPFRELRPDQQDYFRRLAALPSSIVVGGIQADSERTHRPPTEEDLAHVRLQRHMDLLVSVDVPGQGRAAIVPLSSIVTMMPEPEASVPAGPRPLPKELALPEHLVLSAPERGLMVPVLGPARLTELAGEMQRAGLNVLFYPVLYGGYATVPTSAFPLDPALRGSDGFAAAVAAMKPKNIRVVGYLNTLAWQNEGDTPHWLDKRAEWVGVDALGRARLAWAAKHPEVRPFENGMRIPLRNYVSPRIPAVEQRLYMLVDALAKRRDVAGLAFAEWAPLGAEGRLPILGYLPVDRLAGLATTGRDPLDELDMNYNSLYVDGLDGLPMSMKAQRWEKAPDAYVPLLARLLRRAKSARKDWTPWVLDEVNGMDLTAPRKPEDRPVMDRRLSSHGGGSGIQGLFLSVSPPGQGDYLWEGNKTYSEALKGMSGLKLAVLHNQFLQNPARWKPGWTSVILDFREAPGEIAEGLRWVRPPKKAGAVAEP